MINIFVNARFLTQPVSGVQRYGIECSRQIKKLYHNVAFLAPRNILHTDIAAELGVTIIGKNKGHLWEQSDLPAYLSAIGCPPLLNLANTAPLFYKNNFITIHDLAFYHYPAWNSKLFSAWYNWLLPRIAKRAKHIFTVSDTMRTEIIKYYKLPAAKISVTYNGISCAISLWDRSECLVKEKIILSVGSFNIRKNHHKLIQAFIESGLKQQYRLVIIGDKSKVFKHTGLDGQAIADNNIVILRQPAEAELLDTFCRAEIIASLSLYEGFGIPVLEGLYFGCKALCSDIPVYRELYNRYARFCDPHSVSDIRSALEKMVLDRTWINESEIHLLSAKYNYRLSAGAIIQKIVSDTPPTS